MTKTIGQATKMVFEDADSIQPGDLFAFNYALNEVVCVTPQGTDHEGCRLVGVTYQRPDKVRNSYAIFKAWDQIYVQRPTNERVALTCPAEINGLRMQQVANRYRMGHTPVTTWRVNAELLALAGF